MFDVVSLVEQLAWKDVVSLANMRVRVGSSLLVEPRLVEFLALGRKVCGLDDRTVAIIQCSLVGS